MAGEYLSSVCPHDCPSACALEVEVLSATEIGRVRGAADHPYTDGVICAKVQRYRDRVHHPERLTTPLRRVGPKGEGAFEPISWDDALDQVAQAFRAASEDFGPESVWPYYYSGTMGKVQQNGILRLTRLLGYSNMARTICSSASKAGWKAGVGALRGVDAREMVDSELAVIWGCNAVATQVHAAAFAQKARKRNGAKIVVVDPYRTPTAEMADLHLMPRPGTDGALACAVMHVLFAEGLADRDYLSKYTDFPDGLEAHLKQRSPQWAAGLTGIEADQIAAFARLYGRTKKSYIRLGLGMTRQRNGAAAIHAVSCLPAVTGAWTERGGGALLTSSAVFDLDLGFVEATDAPDPGARTLDMSRIGDVLTGDADALKGGPPVKAMLVQNTNPAEVAPDSAKVREGLMRGDLFLCVHEQFPTRTAQYADIVLPATTFLEHDDLYTSYGHTFLQPGRRLVAPVGESRSNHEVNNGLLERLGASHPSMDRTAGEMVDELYRDSGGVGRWVDCQLPFEQAHFLTGFGHPDGRFRFAPDWAALGPLHAEMPTLPDHAPLIEAATAEAPFRLVTAPARQFLNTSFTETGASRKREVRPTALVHPADCADIGIADGDAVRLANKRGVVTVHTKPFDGLPRGVVIVEGIWPEEAFMGGRGINTLVGSDPIPPIGGAAFHDTAVRLERA